MKRTVAITQPTFLPWSGYFDLVASADVFVLLDTVQFEKQSWQSRNRIQSRSGEITWLSVPLRKAPLDTPLNQIRIASQPSSWRRKQRRTVTESLSQCPNFADLSPALEAVYDVEHDHLAELNETFIRHTSQLLGIDTEIIRASELSATGRRVDLLLEICTKTGADRYYSNAGSAAYLEQERTRFDALGIQLDYQQWTHPHYPQTAGGSFVSHLSVIDAIAHLGSDALASHYHGH